MFILVFVVNFLNIFNNFCFTSTTVILTYSFFPFIQKELNNIGIFVFPCTPASAASVSCFPVYVNNITICFPRYTEVYVYIVVHLSLTLHKLSLLLEPIIRLSPHVQACREGGVLGVISYFSGKSKA